MNLSSFFITQRGNFHIRSLNENINGNKTGMKYLNKDLTLFNFLGVHHETEFFPVCWMEQTSAMF